MISIGQMMEHYDEYGSNDGTLLQVRVKWWNIMISMGQMMEHYYKYAYLMWIRLFVKYQYLL